MKCEMEIQAVQRWKNPSKQAGKYRKQYTYVCPVCANEVTPYFYAAFNCIDFSNIGTRIGDRKKPLNENTIKRIEYGLKKYGSQPLNVVHYTPGYTKPLSDVFGTCTSSDHQSIVLPFIINNQQTTGISFRVNGVDDRLPTISTQHDLNLITPFILKEEHSKNTEISRAIGESLQTQTTRQSMALAIPYIVQMNRTGNAFPVDNALSTVLAGGNHHGIVTNEAWKTFISYFYGQSQASGLDESIGTVSTKDRFALVNYQEPKIEDCYFRMLKPHEIKLAMAFDQNYIVLGSQKDQVKQLGNAVTPPAMQWLVQRGIESLQ
jgi:DNA (cytosine-5)-methyltransferase 1